MTVFLAVVRRALSTIITLFGVSVIIFVVLRLLPGNAVQESLGVSEGLLTKSQIASPRANPSDMVSNRVS